MHKIVCSCARKKEKAEAGHSSACDSGGPVVLWELCNSPYKDISAKEQQSRFSFGNNILVTAVEGGPRDLSPDLLASP